MELLYPMAALICIATMIIKILSPFKGYLNLGDCLVLVAGWILPPAYAFLAAGIGWAFADVFRAFFLCARNLVIKEFMYEFIPSLFKLQNGFYNLKL